MIDLDFALDCCSEQVRQLDAATSAFVQHNALNSLAYNPTLCINCGMCSQVCPHAVFQAGEKQARLVRAEVCMECGACQRNCPTAAIVVDAGVGCAAAMIYAALTGKEPACGPDSGSGCCCG